LEPRLFHNAPPTDFVRVREDRLLAFVTTCFERAGSAPEQAACIARLLVNSDLRGVRSRGYALAMEGGGLNPNPDVRVVYETAAAAILDGDGALGYWPMAQAAARAVDKATETSVGLGLVRHIGHYGSAGHYSRICQEAGCVGLSVQGYRGEAGTPRPEPKPSVGHTGDPPISFAIPAGDGPGVVVDMGASVFGNYAGKPGFEELLEQVPAAFFRSVGLIAVATLLGGALTGLTGPEGDAAAQRWPGARMGGMVLAVDVGQLVDTDLFRAEVERYARDLRANHAPLPGTHGVRLPGELEAERLVEYRRDGIPYAGREQEAARELGERFGMEVPWE